MPERHERQAHVLTWLIAGAFAAGTFAWSAWRWWTFQYGTFDLAFYVQALWLALQGEWKVSLLDVPLMGNHAEPIVFLALPIFALWPHALLLVALQTLALASMPLTALRIARQLGFSPRERFALAAATVLYPATGFIGLHEFHPEALAAPLLLLVYEARLAGKLRSYWLWWLLALGSKENIGLVLVAWAVTHAWIERRMDWAHHRRWNLIPGIVAMLWVGAYGAWIAPALNGGKVDYLELYSHLGKSGGEIIAGFFTRPGQVLGALTRSVTGGDLVWGTLLPFLGLPLIRLRWLVIASPILMQHLLSWRTSEWTIHFHYAAPLVPLFWIAFVEAIRPFSWRGGVIIASLAACIGLQAWRGPLAQLPAELALRESRLEERRWKAALIASVQKDPAASVTAGHPYLSHLGTRRDLHSLHHVLKGLKTLSRQRYVPPEVTDYVVIDYADESTFSVGSGYYHPTMRTVDGSLVPSSERLLHEFLAASTWSKQAVNSLSVLKRIPEKPTPPQNPEEKPSTAPVEVLSHKVVPMNDGASLAVTLGARLALPREEFRWLKLIANRDDQTIEVPLGIIAPDATSASTVQQWVVYPPDVEPGEYRVRLVLINQMRSVVDQTSSQSPIGTIEMIFSAGTMQLR